MGDIPGNPLENLVRAGYVLNPEPQSDGQQDRVICQQSIVPPNDNRLNEIGVFEVLNVQAQPQDILNTLVAVNKSLDAIRTRLER